LALLVTAGLWLRLRGLAADGFADDEIHKWLAAVRYLHGQFGGDDVEHPMLMKWLIAAAALLSPRSWAPEAITRLPNALAGGLSIWVLAMLGRRLLGRAGGLIAAALAACATTFVGYQRIAKEDTLAGLFLLLALWCLAEACAAGPGARRSRWELGAAAACGALLASKYYLLIPPALPIAWAWLRRGREGDPWRIPARRWALLVGVALAVFASINWTPFMPSTWDYLRALFTQQPFTDRSRSETYWFMGRLWGNLAFHYRGNLPVWFWGVFLGVKLALPTLALAAVGLVAALVRRRPAERLLLAWIGVWTFEFTISGGKYARFTISLLPAVFLLAAAGALLLARAIGRWGAWQAGSAPGLRAQIALGAIAVASVATEAQGALAHAPEYRLYLNPLGGGDRNLTWYFPHCDYFDAGLREAMAWIAARAEPGARIASEVDWLVRYYVARDGRPDLVSSLIGSERGCGQGGSCWVVTQAGRRYGHNAAALDRLERQEPRYAVKVAGQDVVRIYWVGGAEPAGRVTAAEPDAVRP
jgi:4-amino-4-deoxy-L-arabinose transferase-like glycosyltransferase